MSKFDRGSKYIRPIFGLMLVGALAIVALLKSDAMPTKNVDGTASIAQQALELPITDIVCGIALYGPYEYAILTAHHQLIVASISEARDVWIGDARTFYVEATPGRSDGFVQAAHIAVPENHQPWELSDCNGTSSRFNQNPRYDMSITGTICNLQVQNGYIVVSTMRYSVQVPISAEGTNRLKVGDSIWFNIQQTFDGPVATSLTPVDQYSPYDLRGCYA